MLISHFVEGVQEDLRNLGQLGGDDLAASTGRLAAVMEPALRGRLLEAINQLVADANEASSVRLELRLAGDDITVVRDEPSVEVTEAPSDLSARFALRLPEDLKALIEQQASRAGASTNSFIVRALSKELSETETKARPRGARTMRGSGQS